MTADEIISDIQKGAIPSKTVADFAEEAYIPQGIEIPRPESVFIMDGISVFSKKSLSTLIGKAKSGKTTCTAWMVAQILKSELKVLWIDTEQGLYYSSRTQFWVLSIYGSPKCDNLLFYDLKLHGPTKRVEIIEILIHEKKPDLIILDGIRDLVFDINEPKEATNTVQKLMQWAEEYNCHICSILHQNKGNEHARGHLGSEMINKSESVIKVEKDEDRNITICSPEFTRGEPFGTYAFERDGAGMPQIINYQPNITANEANGRKHLPKDIDKITHTKIILQAFGSEEKLSYAYLTSAIAASFELNGIPMGISKCKSFIAYYLLIGYIIKPEKNSNRTFYIKNIDNI